MTEEEKKRLEQEEEREVKRTRAALTIAVVAAFLSLFLVVVLVCVDDIRVRRLLEPVLALTLAVLITFGARAVDGPITLGGRRREAARSSQAAASVLLWLGCFCAIQASFVLVDVVARWESPLRACAAADARFRGDVDFAGPHGLRRLRLAGCARLDPRRASVPASINPQRSVELSDDDGLEP
jgi:hypothetical protein